MLPLVAEGPQAVGIDNPGRARGQLLAPRRRSGDGGRTRRRIVDVGHRRCLCRRHALCRAADVGP
ncbi:MAG: hypothetical protein OXG70_08175 [Cyanobacteria bacterium MAG IRC1_bin_28]|nr:hypothetical protein [Cyanobacteria bacterium MAG IRC3_bin_20]MCY3654973.1 hypothetical protein [Cyanobacteria bacterium MAG IRC1_bin_28]MYG65054.1 hypothetical protein [Synechococcus sp. SB0675_bin_7]MYK86228.1 hypothetical protein [Synechococcus sp. SB0669_bin_7]